MTKEGLFERALFALVATFFCLTLSFRPIPHASSSNDTVRYVADLHRYCAGYLSHEQLSKSISYQLFYAATSPACWIGSERFFLFEVAALLPLMFLFFSKWRNGSFLWASSLLFSVYGLELMTNAMRQGFAMFFLFGAVALLSRHLILSLSLGLLAVAAHTSALAFFPLLLWMSGVRLSKKMLLLGLAIMLLVLATVPLVFHSAVFEFFGRVDELRTIFSLIYAKELKASFLLFMLLPLYFVYGLRLLFERKYICGDERRGIVYSSLLLVMSYLIFPYITYRFAIFAVALQIFIVTMSERPGLKVGGFALFGLLLHFFVMMIITDHFDVLFYG